MKYHAFLYGKTLMFEVEKMPDGSKVPYIITKNLSNKDPMNWVGMYLSKEHLQRNIYTVVPVSDPNDIIKELL